MPETLPDRSRWTPPLLDGVDALVTGGSRGIGKGIGLTYARHGARRVSFVSRGGTPDKVEEAMQTAREIEELGAQAVWIQADVSTDQGINKILTHLGDTGTKIDVLVNNAGNTFNALAQLNPPGLLDASYNLNLRAPVLLASRMKEEGLYAPEARVIFIGSIIGKFGNTGQINYAAMKQYEGVVKTLTEEWGPEGMRINALYPGFVPTEMTEEVAEGPLQMIADMTPLQNRLGTVDDIAKAAVFFGSDLSSFVTGEGLSVDGGLGGKAPGAFILWDNNYRPVSARQRRQLGIE